MPEPGATVPKHMDWIGIGSIEDVSDQLEAWEMMCGEGEANDRSFSPFEFTAAAINARDEKFGEGSSEQGWEAFDKAIERGRNAYRRKHYPLKAMRRDFAEYIRETENS